MLLRKVDDLKNMDRIVIMAPFEEQVDEWFIADVQEANGKVDLKLRRVTQMVDKHPGFHVTLLRDDMIEIPLRGVGIETS